VGRLRPSWATRPCVAHGGGTRRRLHTLCVWGGVIVTAARIARRRRAAAVITKGNYAAIYCGRLTYSWRPLIDGARRPQVRRRVAVAALRRRANSCSLERTRICGQVSRTGGTLTKPTNSVRSMADKRRRRLVRHSEQELSRVYAGLTYCPGGNKCGRHTRWRREISYIDPKGQYKRIRRQSAPAN